MKTNEAQISNMLENKILQIISGDNTGVFQETYPVLANQGVTTSTKGRSENEMSVLQGRVG